jgi:transposase-like protein
MNRPCPNCGSCETTRMYGNPALNKFEYSKYKCHKCGAEFVHDVDNRPKTDGWRRNNEQN